MDNITEDRLNEIYAILAENCEDKNIYANRKLSELNGKLLDFVIYLYGEEDINPLYGWFELD